jgi:superoxide dismutase, Cu-Zn family
MLRRHHKMVTVLGALAMVGASLGALATTVGADRDVSDSARALGALGWDDDDWKDRGRGHGKRFAFAKLVNADGAPVGSVQLSQWDDKVLVVGRARGIPAGFHGFHVHAVGKCEGPAFTTAGGHLADAGQSHPAHKGDLPSLLVDEEGNAVLITTTDRFSLEDLRDADGAAIIVHANPDNYANIPTDRYEPDPDATTLSTGDAGGRIACGMVR